MKKNKALTFFVILTTILFFSSAALIDQCSMFSGSRVDENNSKSEEIVEETFEEESNENTGEEPPDEVIEETLPEEENIESTGQEESVERDENQPPVVTDIIFSSAIFIPGSIYDVTYIANDPDGDTLICEWGVDGGTIADMYDNPIKWTAPDEEGSYYITVRVYDNNGGTHMRGEYVDVMYQQIEMEAEGNGTETQIEMGAVFQIEFPQVWAESGNIRFDRDPDIISDDWGFSTGDTRLNEHEKAFISFDITDFQGGNIKSVILTLERAREVGDVSFYENLEIYSANWGPRALVSSDYHLLGTLLATSPVSSGGNVMVTSPELKHEFLQAVEQGRSRFQIIFFLSPVWSDNDNLNDGWGYDHQINLKISYET